MTESGKSPLLWTGFLMKELIHSIGELMSLLFEKNWESIFIGKKKNGNAPERRMSHQKIKNVFQWKTRPDFDVKILIQHEIQNWNWKCIFHFMGTLNMTPDLSMVLLQPVAVWYRLDDSNNVYDYLDFFAGVNISKDFTIQYRYYENKYCCLLPYWFFGTALFTL